MKLEIDYTQMCCVDMYFQQSPTLRWGVAAVILIKTAMKVEIDYTQMCCVDIYVSHKVPMSRWGVATVNIHMNDCRVYIHMNDCRVYIHM